MKTSIAVILKEMYIFVVTKCVFWAVKLFNASKIRTVQGTVILQTAVHQQTGIATLSTKPLFPLVPRRSLRQYELKPIILYCWLSTLLKCRFNKVKQVRPVALDFACLDMN